MVFPTGLLHHTSRSSPGRRHLHELGVVSRALVYGWNTSRRPKTTCAPASWDSWCLFPSTVFPRWCPLPTRNESRVFGPTAPTASSRSVHVVPPHLDGFLHPARSWACCIPHPVMRFAGFPAFRSRSRFHPRRSLARDGLAVAIPPCATPLEESPSPAAVPRHRGLLPSCRCHPPFGLPKKTVQHRHHRTRGCTVTARYLLQPMKLRLRVAANRNPLPPRHRAWNDDTEAPLVSTRVPRISPATSRRNQGSRERAPPGAPGANPDPPTPRLHSTPPSGKLPSHSPTSSQKTPPSSP